MKIRYRGQFTYYEDTQTAQYCLFDMINNRQGDLVSIKGKKDECLYQYGLAQKEYYIKYPRLLPKGIITSDNTVGKNFKLIFAIPHGKGTLTIGYFVTVQETIQAKKDFIAFNI